MLYRIIISAGLFIFSGQLFSQQVTYVKPNIYAVVVGVSDYKDPNIPDLKYPEKDAASMYNFLRSPFAGSIPAENIGLLTGPRATMSNILKEVVDKFSRSGKEDMVIFYFSGHGKAGDDESGYLMSYDSDFDNEFGTAISMPILQKRIDGFKAKMKISFVDACHAGLFTSSGKGVKEDENAVIAKSYMESLSKSNKGSVRFLASSARQESGEDPQLEHGVFTYYLVKGLQGAADLSQPETGNYNDGVVNISELNTYLTANISKHTKFKQSPSVEGIYNDQFPVSILKPGISLTNVIAKTRSYEEEKTVPQKISTDLSSQSDPNNKKSKNPKCREENTGDYCFQNNTALNLEVTLTYTQPKLPDGTFSVYTNFKSILLPGQKQCFYNVPAGPGKYFINNEPGIVIGPAPRYYHAESTTYIEPCIENFFIIK